MNRRRFLSVSGLAALGAPRFRALPIEAAQNRWQPDGAAALARLGVLTPEFDPVPESEISAMAPPGVSIHAARVRRNPAAAFAAPPHVDTAAEQLADLAALRRKFLAPWLAWSFVLIFPSAVVAAITFLPTTPSGALWLFSMMMIGCGYFLATGKYNRLAAA